MTIPGAKRGSGKRAAGFQYGALPFRRGSVVEVMLITSRETRRWVIPKGWPMKGRKPHVVAAIEALEEAGISGRIGKAALGAYAYAKRLANGTPLRVQVRVFPLQVLRERAAWPEMAERERRWFTIDAAVEAVAEPELKALIRALAGPVPKAKA